MGRSRTGTRRRLRRGRRGRPLPRARGPGAARELPRARDDLRARPAPPQGDRRPLHRARRPDRAAGGSSAAPGTPPSTPRWSGRCARRAVPPPPDASATRYRRTGLQVIFQIRLTTPEDAPHDRPPLASPPLALAALPALAAGAARPSSSARRTSSRCPSRCAEFQGEGDARAARRGRRGRPRRPRPLRPLRRARPARLPRRSARGLRRADHPLLALGATSGAEGLVKARVRRDGARARGRAAPLRGPRRARGAREAAARAGGEPRALGAPDRRRDRPPLHPRAGRLLDPARRDPQGARRLGARRWSTWTAETRACSSPSGTSCSRPAWRPDGAEILVTSYRTGRPRALALPARGPELPPARGRSPTPWAASTRPTGAGSPSPSREGAQHATSWIDERRRLAARAGSPASRPSTSRRPGRPTASGSRSSPTAPAPRSST